METCIACEHETAEKIATRYGTNWDDDCIYPDADGYSYEEYKCSYCGAIFRLGEQVIRFAHILVTGDKKKQCISDAERQRFTNGDQIWLVPSSKVKGVKNNAQTNRVKK